MKHSKTYENYFLVTGDGMIQEGELEDVLRACLQERTTQNLLLT